jgi:CheY-like chemotaxis protein
MTRVLVVEDNPESLELMRYLLQAFGYQALICDNGQDGVATARRAQPDLIICDINMPELDGYGVLRELKHDPTLREIRLIAVTALAMVGDREKVLAAGFDGYIAKPIDPMTFVSSVQDFLAPLRAQSGRDVP